MEEDEIFEETKKQNNNGTGCLIAIILLIIIIVILCKLVVSWWNNLGNSSDTNDLNTNSLSTNNTKVPDEIELMSYAQTVLKDNLTNPKYSSYKGDYNFIETGLRYKIEGKVNDERFWMIIQFVDDTYQEYDLISLQVGDERIF